MKTTADTKSIAVVLAYKPIEGKELNILPYYTKCSFCVNDPKWGAVILSVWQAALVCLGCYCASQLRHNRTLEHRFPLPPLGGRGTGGGRGYKNRMRCAAPLADEGARSPGMGASATVRSTPIYLTPTESRRGPHCRARGLRREAAGKPRSEAVGRPQGGATVEAAALQMRGREGSGAGDAGWAAPPERDQREREGPDAPWARRGDREV